MAWKFVLSLPFAVQASALMKDMPGGGSGKNCIDKDGGDQKDVFEPHGERLGLD